MRHLLLIYLCFNSLFSCWGQGSNVFLVPFEQNGQWGYMNVDKEVIVRPQFDEAYPTYGQMGRVRKNGKYGFIDSQGKVIVKLKYDTADDNKYGYALTTKGEKEFHFNSSGKINRQIGARCGTGPYLKLGSEISIVFKGNNGKYGMSFKKLVVAEDGSRSWVPDTVQPIFDTIVSLSNQYMYVVKDGKIAFTNSIYYSNGSKIILDKMVFMYDELKFFQSEYTGEVQPIIGIREGRKWGYYRVLGLLHGEVLIEPKYLTIYSLEMGFALVEYLPNKFGYIDKFGNEYFTRN